MKRTLLRSWWGIVGYNGQEWVVGTGMLDITDPNNPQVFNDWSKFNKEDYDIEDSAKEPLPYKFGGWKY